MSAVIAELNLKQSPTPAGRRPQLALRGFRRSKVILLRNYLDLVLRQDLAEIRRGERDNRTPYIFRKEVNSKEHKAMTLLIRRCDEALNARI